MRALALLLQLSDSALPTGGFSHSFGFEQYLSRGEVHDASTFSQWLRVFVATQLTYTDALLMRMAYDGVCEDDLADRALAATSPAPPRMGQSSLRIGGETTQNRPGKKRPTTSRPKPVRTRRSPGSRLRNISKSCLGKTRPRAESRRIRKPGSGRSATINSRVSFSLTKMTMMMMRRWYANDPR